LREIDGGNGGSSQNELMELTKIIMNVEGVARKQFDMIQKHESKLKEL